MMRWRRRRRDDARLRAEVARYASEIEKIAASFGVDRILEPRLSEIELRALAIRQIAQREVT